MHIKQTAMKEQMKMEALSPQDERAAAAVRLVEAKRFVNRARECLAYGRDLRAIVRDTTALFEERLSDLDGSPEELDRALIFLVEALSGSARLYIRASAYYQRAYVAARGEALGCEEAEQMHARHTPPWLEELEEKLKWKES